MNRRMTILASMLIGIVLGWALWSSLPELMAQANAPNTRFDAITIQPGTAQPAMFFDIRNDAGTTVFSSNKTTGVFTFATVPVFSAGIGATTFNPGITLGAAGVTGTLTSPFTPTAGVDTFFSLAPSGAAAVGDIIIAFGDSVDSTEHTFLGDGDYTADGLITGTMGVTSSGTLTGTGIVTLGDGGDAFSVASTGLDVSAAGAISNATTIAMAGALSGVTTLTATGTATLGIVNASGDVTLSDGAGGNGDNYPSLIGDMAVVIRSVLGTTGAQDVIMEDGEAASAGTWTDDTGGQITLADDAVFFKRGAAALRLTFGAVGVGNTATSPAIGPVDASGDEYIYVWVRSTVTTAAADLRISLDDDTAAPDPVVNLGAIAATGVWQLMRVDISAVADADKNVISDFSIQVNHATALDGAVVRFDSFLKVDAAETAALTDDVRDVNGGAYSVLGIPTAAATDFSATRLVLLTDFEVDSVNNAIAFLTDQSARQVMVITGVEN